MTALLFPDLRPVARNSDLRQKRDRIVEKTVNRPPTKRSRLLSADVRCSIRSLRPSSGVAMAWAGWAKSRRPRVPGKNFVAWASCARAWVKLLTDCKFWAVNCAKCVWRPGSARTRWGAIALPRPPGRYKGERKGSGEEGKGWEEEGRVKGRDGSTWILQ